MRRPFFHFYPDDFLAGTLSMSLEERGLYITLLSIQWTKGGFIEEEWGRHSRAMATPMAKYVLGKFEKGPDGLYRNARLERERSKFDTYHANLSKSGRSGAEKRWGKNGQAIASPLPGHSDAIATPIGSSWRNDGNPDRREKEREEIPSDRSTTIPTEDEVVAAGALRGITEPWARKWFKDRQFEGWCDRNGADIGNWRAYMLKAWNMERGGSPSGSGVKPKKKFQP